MVDDLPNSPFGFAWPWFYGGLASKIPQVLDARFDVIYSP
jgi:hypothetical protein